MTGKIAFVFARVCMCAAVASVLAAESSAATCTWTGNAGDHKWSTAENWDTPPVSGRGDTVILKSVSNGEPDLTAIDLDVQGMSVWIVNFGDSASSSGTQPVTLTGNTLTVTGGNSWKCYEVVSNYAPVVFTNTDKVTLTCGYDVFFFGAVTSACSTLYTTQVSAQKKGTVNFRSSLVAPSAEITGLLSSFMHGPSRLASVTSGAGGGNDFVHVSSSGNDFPLAEVSFFGRIFAEVPYSLPTNLVMSWRHDYPEKDTQDQSFKLYGDQIVDRVAGSVPTNSAGVVLGVKRNVIEAMSASELTLRATASATTYASCRGAMSLVYDPQGSFVQEFCDRAQTMTGTIRVKGGTLSSLGANTFASATRLTVDDGATFRVGASVISGATNPFTGTTDLFLYGAGALDVAAGVTVTFNRAFVDGMIVSNTTYQALDGTDADAVRVPWVKGAGLVSASFVGTSWKKSGTGAWNAPENWSNGVPARDTPVYFDTTVIGPCEATLGTGDVWPTSLEIAGAGATIRVADGASVSYDGNGLSSTLVLRDGAALAVDGTLTITNWVGTFSVESATAATSRVDVAGTFAFATKSTSALKSKSYPIHVKRGGLLNVAGGAFSGRDSYVPAVSMEGGDVRSSGAGTLRFYGTPFSFGTGTAAFDGNSELGIASAGNLVWSPAAAGESLDVVFNGTSKFASDGEITGVTVGGTTDGGRTRVEFASDASHARLGYGTLVHGSGTGEAELAVSDGFVAIGGRGLDVASGGADSTARTGRLTVSGGIVENQANKWWAEHKPYGLTIAYGPSTKAGSTAGDVFGSAAFSGGVFSNKTSNLLIGVGGNARGEMLMTGGTFLNAAADHVVGIGFAGGTGTLTVSNGTFDVAGDMYVGGAHTNVFIEGHPFANWPVDLHNARGELAVAGGKVKIGGDLVLGADGCGRLVRTGTGGSLAVAGDLVCSNTVLNAESGAELVFEIEGLVAPSPVAVGGSFDVRRGAKAVVRIGDALQRRGRIPLVRAASIAGELSDIAVSIEGGGRHSSEVRPYMSNGTFGVCVRRGFMVIVE